MEINVRVIEYQAKVFRNIKTGSKVHASFPEGYDTDISYDGTVKAAMFLINSRTGKPIFCIVDDTISSKTKPSSKAKHPIEDAYFHQSHLKKKQDYGHQAVSVMLSCNGIVLNYAFVMYDKSMSKVKIVQDIADELPPAPVISYLLCDSWYTSAKTMGCFILKGFYTIGALKVNQVIYPLGIKQQVKQFAPYMRKTDRDVHLVTVGSRQYYVKRYEGKLNGVENAVVLISYPKNAFLDPKALRAFICTDVSLETEEILSYYVERWPNELFFRQSTTPGQSPLRAFVAPAPTSPPHSLHSTFDADTRFARCVKSGVC